MRPLLVVSVLFLGLLPIESAFAADDAVAADDEDLLDDEEAADEADSKKKKDETKPSTTTTVPTVDPAEEEGLDAIEPGEDGDEDLLEEGEERVAGPGRDSDSIYREYLAKVKGESPDEELLLWDKYLEKYPDSYYKDRIRDRMKELEQDLYAERIEDPNAIDADEREIYLAEGYMLDSLNPRTRLQVGFELGLPSFQGFVVDYEHQILRNLSVHGGVIRRLPGVRLDLGTRYALIKSTRLQTVVGVIGDFEFNMNPAYPVFRPQIGAGKKFFDVLDAQVQGGIELDTRKGAAVRGIAGANVSWRAADTVAIFAETNLYMQRVTNDDGTLFFRFNTINFGLKFYPKFKAIDKDALETAFATSVPYTGNYWMYHFGSISVLGNYYL